MMEKFSYKNLHQVPALKKIVLSTMTRDAVANSKVAQALANELTLMAGQRAVVARAKKSIATFKVREGQPVGAYVTLRKGMMYEFFDRLISITLPRVRDFRGVSLKGLDQLGNYSFGIKEQIVFPEIDYDKIDKVRGVAVAIETSAKNRKEGQELLSLFGMPFKRK